MPGSLFNVGKMFSKNPVQSNDAGGLVDPQEAGVTGSSPSVLPPTSPTPSLNISPIQSLENGGNTTSEAVKIKNTQVQSGSVVEKIAPDKENLDNKPQESLVQKRAGMDVLSRLTQRSNKALVSGVSKAKEHKVSMVDTEYVLWGLIQDSGIYQLISDMKVVPTDLVAEIEKAFTNGSATEAPKFSPRVKKVLELSFPVARKLGYEFISPEHILLGLSEEGEGLAAQLLAKHNIMPESLKKKIGVKTENDDENKEKTATSQYATDLTQLAREGKLDPVIARSKEIERMMHILSRRSKNNPVLIGDAGVGKTAIVEGLAQRIVAGNVPEPLLNRRILALDLMGLIAGASQRGEFEKRFKSLINEVKASQGEIILFIDELHSLVGAGGSGGAMDASNILKPSLARGEMQTIGTTTVTEYRKYIEKDRALERRFQPVLVNEPTQDEAVDMLRGIIDKYEAFHKVSITDEAIRAAVRLSARYIGDRFLPDKAVDLIDEAASAVKMPAISLPEEITSREKELSRQEAELKDAQNQHNDVKKRSVEKKIENLKIELVAKKQEHEIKKGSSTTQVTPEMIQQIVSQWTGIPISRLTESESKKLINLEDVIHEKFIDQEEAVSAISEAVRRGRSGLSSQKRPIGSFIFMGPTGVGKTQLAKVLAEELYGSENMMVRLDMTEYMEKHEVAKLIGAPPGYVGYDEGGQLTEAVRRKPYSVVLLDEIEKAHPDVFNILLQILDDGRLTDNKGQTISFKNTMLICTSNIGTGLIQKTMLSEMSAGDIKSSVNKKINLNTYTISPTGRVMVTRDKDLWQKSTNDPWAKSTLANYFAGQKVLNYDALSQKEKFPENGLNTHVILPSGAEVLTAKDRAWKRTSTIVKEWNTISLIDYFANNRVTNAKPDRPEEQLPTAYWETHAVSPTEKEAISMDGRIWVRNNQQNAEWKVYLKKDYLKSEIKEESTQNQQSSLNKNDQNPPVYSSNELKTNYQPDSKKEQIQGTLPPETKWDAHVFTPKGEEIIVVNTSVWKRNSNSVWVKNTIGSLLSGVNAPEFIPTQDETKTNDKNAGFDKLTDQLLDELRKFFKPELLNRFDEITVFKPLTAEHMFKIIELQVEILRQKLEEQDLGLEMSESVKEELTIVGFDPIFGARPLRRTIQRLIENQISTMLIKGDLNAGDTVAIDFDADANDFVFTVKSSKKQTESIDDSEVKLKEETDDEIELSKTAAEEPEKINTDMKPPVPVDQKMTQDASNLADPSTIMTQTPSQNDQITPEPTPEAPVTLDSNGIAEEIPLKVVDIPETPEKNPNNVQVDFTPLPHFNDGIKTGSTLSTSPLPSLPSDNGTQRENA